MNQNGRLLGSAQSCACACYIARVWRKISASCSHNFSVDGKWLCHYFTHLQLFSVILLAIGLILGSVSIGIGQWSRLETDRNDGEVMDGATVKTLGLLSRCVSYTLTTEVLSLGLSQEDQPQVRCYIMMKLCQLFIINFLLFIILHRWYYSL